MRKDLRYEDVSKKRLGMAGLGKASKAACLPLAAFLIITGYYKLASVAPEAPFEAVLSSAKEGTLLTFFGALLLVFCLRRARKFRPFKQ